MEKMTVTIMFLLLPVTFAFEIEFNLVYHHQDAAIATAVRYAANRLSEVNAVPAPSTTHRQSTVQFPQGGSSPALTYYYTANGNIVGPVQQQQQKEKRPTTQSSAMPPRLVFREVATNFDNYFAAGEEICKLLEGNKLAILIGYRFEHLALLRSYSRQFRIPLILLDTGLDRASELLSLKYDEEQLEIEAPPETITTLPPYIQQQQSRVSELLGNPELKLKLVGSSPGEAPSQYEVQFGLPYMNAVYKAIEQKGWTSFYAIHDSEDGLRRLHALFQRLSMAQKIVEAKFRQLNFGEESDVADELKYYHRDTSNLLIDIRNSTSLAYLTKAFKDYDLFNDQVDFLLLGLDFGTDLEDVFSSLNLRGKDARVSGFHVISRADQQTSPVGEVANLQKVMRDWRNLDPRFHPGAGTNRLTANQAFAMDFASALGNVLKRWSLSDGASFANLYERKPGKRSNGIEAGRCLGRHVLALDVGPDIARRLKATAMPRRETMTGHLQFNEHGERIGFTFYYHGQETTRVGFRRLGRYGDQTGFEYISASEDRRSRNASRQDQNQTRIVTTIGVEPFLKLKEDHHRRVGNDRFEGYIADLTQAVAEWAQFKYEIRLVGDNAYGSQNATGHWNGMMGEVIYGVADMAIAPLTITATREKVVDFTKPFMTLGISIQIKKPQKTKPSVFSFLDPLSYEIWLCIGFAYIGVSVVLFLVSRFSPYEWHEEGSDECGGADSKANQHDSQNSSSGESMENHRTAQRRGSDTNNIRYSLPGYFYTSVVSNFKGRNENTEQKMKEFAQAVSLYKTLLRNTSGDESSPNEASTSSHGMRKIGQLRAKKYINDFTFSNSLWFSLGAFMRQDVDISPRCVSGRIVGSVWWFFTLIIISSYTANLAAFLTVERMSTPVESAEDLGKQTEIKYGTLRRGSTAQFFQTSKSSTYQRMWAYMASAEPSVFVDAIDDGIRRVRKSNGKYAFLLESTMNEYINSRKPCDTMKVGINLDSKGYGIATPKGSDLKELLNLAVLELREKGVLQVLEKKWWVEKGECDNTEIQRKDQSQNALTLPKVAGVFYILIGGLALAMVASLCEFLYRAKLDAQKQNLPLTEIVRQHTAKRLEPSSLGFARGSLSDQPLGTMLMASEYPRQRGMAATSAKQAHQFIPDKELGKGGILAQSSISVV